ncbi:MAG: phosphoenolpyruvate carboxylase [Bdellovibrio sp.]
MAQHLAKELTSLVNWSVSELGKVIESELGKSGFRRVEKIRRHVKSSPGQTLKGLLKLKKELELLPAEERFQIAHAFSLMLELINSCEAAYRAFRLKKSYMGPGDAKRSRPGNVIHVLTAHPTESRSADILFYFRKIQNLLEQRLERAQDGDTESLHLLLQCVWRIPMSKQRKPSVMDEAEYIYSLALQQDILHIFARQKKTAQPFYIRSWVGGDKDGHPGVDEKTMLGSLQMARGHLLERFLEILETYIEELRPLAHASDFDRTELQKLLKSSLQFRKSLSALRKIKARDDQRVQGLRQQLDVLARDYKKWLHADSPSLQTLRMLLKVFPGMVVPLEVREDSGMVQEALRGSPRKYAISRMLDTLKKISPQHDPRFYVRGFVLSQTESAKDINSGFALVKKHLGEVRLPVVPLFESASALKSGVQILEEFLKKPARKKVIKKFWSGKFEVMVGYSDSAKENGSFPSRFLISSAVQDLENVIRVHGLTPIFFHGSGGSIERGGGSVQEQTDWWPQSALDSVKVTVQGEMIYRNYAASEILDRQLQKFTQARNAAQGVKKLSVQSRRDLARMSDFIQDFYQQTLKQPDFLHLIEKATPYSFLKNLKMGSRPAKRQGSFNIKNLRAIPWVLCWTQTRILFPTWWGVGRFWQSLSSRERSRYKKVFKESALFRSYVKNLGFTLAKIEMDVFALYLESSGLEPEVVKKFLREFREEYKYCCQAVRDLSGHRSLLWYRPWLETSIHLRSPLIHPLNVLQIVALQSKDVLLLRESVTGVASGMLTTG